MDLAIYRSTHLALYRSTDLQIHRSSGLLIHRPTDPPIYQSTGPIYKSTNPQVQDLVINWSIDLQIYRHSHLQIYWRCTDLQIHRSSHPPSKGLGIYDSQIYRSIDVEIYYSDQQFPLLAITTEPMINQFVELLVHWSIDPQMHLFTDLPIHWFTDSPIQQSPNLSIHRFKNQATYWSIDP